jgi:hypothetical protein
VTAQPLEALPVVRLFGLLLAIPAVGLSPSQQLNVLVDDADACRSRLDAAANDLPAFAPCFPDFLFRPTDPLFPVHERLGERVCGCLPSMTRTTLSNAT